MRVVFLGVGEAFDHRLPNTSLLLVAEAGDALLCDCGFTAAAAFFAHKPADLHVDSLVGITVSHFHGDHFMGLPWLLHRLRFEGRRAPLAIVGGHGVEDVVAQVCELAYPESLAKLGFPLTFKTVTDGDEIDMDDWRLSFARTNHPEPNLAVRVFREDSAVLYSGDGAPTTGVQTLAQRANLAVMESFMLREEDVGDSGHGSVAGSLAFAELACVDRVALTHVHRRVRHDRRDELETMLAWRPDVPSLLPAPGDVVTL